MTGPSKTVAVTILDKEYQVSCPESDCEALYESARLLDKKMKEIRNSGKITGLDRIVVMAALNIAHELLRQQSKNEVLDRTVGDQIRSLQDKVDQALSES